MRCVLALLVASVCLTLAPAPRARAATTAVSFRPATVSVNAGESFTIDVFMESDTPTRAIQFGLRYDSSVVQIDRVADGTYYQNWAQGIGAQAITAVPFKADNAAGLLSIGGISTVGGPSAPLGATGAGSVLTLQMTAKPGIRGATHLAFVSLYVADTLSQKLPSVLGTPAVIGVGTDPTSLRPPAPLEYRPPIAASVSIDLRGSASSAPTPDPVQSGLLPAPQVRFAESASLAAAPTPTLVPPEPTTPPLATPTSPPPIAPATVPSLVASASAPSEAVATVAPSSALAAPAPLQAQPSVVPPTQGSAPAPAPVQPSPAMSPVSPGAQPPAFQPLTPPGAGQAAAQTDVRPLGQSAAPAAAQAPPAQTSIVATPRPLSAAAPVIKPRGSGGIYLPWELIAAVGGATAVVGALLFVLRQRAPSSGR